MRKSDEKASKEHTETHEYVADVRTNGCTEITRPYYINDSVKKTRMINVDALWCMYICSVIAGCNAEIFTFPLDLVKTRLQIQGETASKIGTGPKKGMIGTSINVVKQDGIFGLWKGVSAVFVRHMIYSGLRLVIYRQLKDVFVKRHPDQKIFPIWQGTVCGMTAGAIAQFFANPADLIKVQLQMEGKRRMLGLPPRVHGFRDAFIKIYEPGGIKGLWKGWVPAVQRAALVNFGDLTTYDISKRFIQRHTNLDDQWVLHSFASMAAGFAGAVLSTPADVIKSRVMNQPIDEHGKGLLYKGSMDCFQKAIKEEGFLALYKGFVPTWIRLGPWALVFWVTYEQLRILIGGELF